MQQRLCPLAAHSLSSGRSAFAVEVTAQHDSCRIPHLPAAAGRSRRCDATSWQRSHRPRACDSSGWLQDIYEPTAVGRRRRSPTCREVSVAGAGSSSSSSSSGDNTAFGMLMQYAAQMQQQLEEQQRIGQQLANTGAHLTVAGLGFHPPGTEAPLLTDVSMTLPTNKLGLVIGRSGSGKTTLLQLLAGLSEQTSGAIYITPTQLPVPAATAAAAASPDATAATSNSDNGRNAIATSGSVPVARAATAPAAAAPAAASAAPPAAAVAGAAPTRLEERMQKMGLVFQFPERHFLADDLLTELTFAWPRGMTYWAERQQLTARLQQVVRAVGMQDIPMNASPVALSGGQQRRLALAIQLIRRPSVLLLDEPLAGLDWVSRREVVALLHQLKSQCTLLVVSHDLKEISPLVDVAWRMQPGGRLQALEWPPEGNLSDLEQ